MRIGRMSDQFPLRFPPGLRDRIREAASENLRSMNAEIIVQLERAYKHELETKKADATA